jgi:hypothetical protein
MEITGDQADSVGPEIGPTISGDFPRVIAAPASAHEARLFRSCVLLARWMNCELLSSIQRR